MTDAIAAARLMPGNRVAAELIGSRVEERSPEGVIGSGVVGVLTSTASADGEIAAAAGPAPSTGSAWTTWAAAPARSSRSARASAASGPAEPVLPESAGLSAGSSGDAETWRQFACRAPELAASERLEAIAEHAAIEAGAVAGERHRL